MPTLQTLLDTASHCSVCDNDWLRLLTNDWQIVADISFSDLVLYIDMEEKYLIGAHARPATAATLIERDVIGTEAQPIDLENIRYVFHEAQILEEERDSVSHIYIPVKHHGNVLAVVHVYSALMPDRVPLQTHENYEDLSRILFNMICTGEFPMEGTPGLRHGMPKVSDGVVRVDEEGVVLYASPNAVSNLRRLGMKQTLVGEILVQVVTELIAERSMPEESLPLVLMGRAAWVSELESNDVIIAFRSIPLLENGKRLGAIVLTRNITEVRRQEQRLLSKNATIKEINHRVKNNLQTVSALLRLQARSAKNEESKYFLEKAQRRVSMIAIVHEALSQTVDEVVEFDVLFTSLLRAVRDVSFTENNIDISLHGSFGRVRAEQATALAMVLNELISNAMEHGIPDGGNIIITAQRDEQILTITVADDGLGIPENKIGTGLGTQILQTLVQTELQGDIRWENIKPTGAAATVVMRLQN